MGYWVAHGVGPPSGAARRRRWPRPDARVSKSPKPQKSLLADGQTSLREGWARRTARARPTSADERGERKSIGVVGRAAEHGLLLCVEPVASSPPPGCGRSVRKESELAAPVKLLLANTRACAEYKSRIARVRAQGSARASKAQGSARAATARSSSRAGRARARAALEQRHEQGPAVTDLDAHAAWNAGRRDDVAGMQRG
jgi:hypothetical protein